MHQVLYENFPHPNFSRLLIRIRIRQIISKPANLFASGSAIQLFNNT